MRTVSRFFLASSIFLYLLSPLAAIAANPTVPDSPDINPSNITTPVGFLTLMQTILGWAFAFAIVIGTAMIIVAGIMYMTAAGNQDRVKTAVKVMVFAIVGIAITGFAWAIVNVIQGIIFTTPVLQ